MKKSLIVLSFFCSLFASLMMGCLSFEVGKDSIFNQKELMLSYRTLFKSGSEGYLSYRKPLLIRIDEKLFAFAEGRKRGFFESGDIDIVYKKSLDGGKSWSKLIVAVDDENNACTRPCVGLLPLANGKVKMLLAFTWNLGSDYENEIIEGKGKEKSKIFLLSSEDDALTWSEKRDITPTIKKSEWDWTATVTGKMLFSSQNSSLILPCQHYDKSLSLYRSHLAVSEDSATSWSLGAIFEGGTGELQLAQGEEGVLVASLRSFAPLSPSTSQLILYSLDGGKKWVAPTEGKELIASGCQNSILFDSSRSAFFFCNPADTKRQRLALKKASFDPSFQNQTEQEKRLLLKQGVLSFLWQELLVLWKGAAAFSSMESGNDALWVLFEAGKDFPYERILFTSVASPILENLPQEQ